MGDRLLKAYALLASLQALEMWVQWWLQHVTVDQTDHATQNQKLMQH